MFSEPDQLRLNDVERSITGVRRQAQLIVSFGGGKWHEIGADVFLEFTPDFIYEIMTEQNTGA